MSTGVKTFYKVFSIDYIRNTGRPLSCKTLIHELIGFKNNPIKFIFCWRATQNIRIPIVRQLFMLIYYHYSAKYGFEISTRAKIEPGLRLPHYGGGGVVLHPGVVIGRNCEIMQGVTIGNNIQKNRYNVATVGDNVILCSGCKLIGDVHIGSNVIVGANAVVTHDIPDNCIVGGVPARILKNDATPVIINADY